MTPEQFVYWLQGFSEIDGKRTGTITAKQWEIIQDHLKEVFHKKTPNRILNDKVTVPYIPPSTQPFPEKWPPGTVIC